jgi:hypothetical protein
MKVMYTPAYCGGRFLFGFWPPGHIRDPETNKLRIATDEDIIRQNFKVGRIYEEYDFAHSTSYDAIPKSLDNFKLLLKYVINVFGGTTMYAVTNDEQKLGEKHLEAVGFKVVASHNNSGNICKSWIADISDLRDYLRDTPTLDVLKYI